MVCKAPPGLGPVALRLLGAASLSLFIIGSTVACGGATVPDSSAPPAPTDSGVPLPSNAYPAGTIAALSLDDAGIGFFSYSPASGFAPTGTLAAAACPSANVGPMAFDSRRQLYLTCGQEIFVYSSGSTGDATPVRVITVPSTPLGDLRGTAIDSDGNVYLLREGRLAADGGLVGSGILVFGPDSDSVPIRTIEGPLTGLFHGGGLALDRSGNLYAGANDPGVPGAEVVVAPIVEFPAGATGNVAPSRLIGGPGVINPLGVAVDSSGLVYGTFQSGTGSAVEGIGVFNGPSLVRNISGPTTQLDFAPWQIALDPTGRIYAATGNSVVVFRPGASGDVAPEGTLSAATGYFFALAP